RTKTRCRTRRSSKRTGRTSSRESTSCERCGASIRACHAGCTCTSGTGKCSKRITRRCLASTLEDAGCREEAGGLAVMGRLGRGEKSLPHPLQPPASIYFEGDYG